MSVFEVCGGNDRRSMIKRYERKSKQEAIRELVDIIHCNWNQVEQLEATCETLRGLTPEPPPRPPEGAGLPRYGLRWNGPQQPLSVPMEDGYWTPWHLAAAALQSPDAQARLAAIDALLQERSPLPRTGDDMDLPAGKTCADCAHCKRCTTMFGHIPADESCDWSPSRFTPKRTEAPQQ